MLPDGQVQMIYTLPAGSVPPPAYQQYPYGAQPAYGQVPQPQYIQYPMNIDIA